MCFALQFEPWPMIMSFVQYLLMAPSYIGVLNVYAVCLFFFSLYRSLFSTWYVFVMGYQG